MRHRPTGFAALALAAALALTSPAFGVEATDGADVSATVNTYLQIDVPSSIDFGNVDVGSTVERTANPLYVTSNVLDTQVMVSRTAFGSTFGPTDFALRIRGLDIPAYTDIPVGGQLALRTYNSYVYTPPGSPLGFDLQMVVPLAVAGTYHSTVTFTIATI